MDVAGNHHAPLRAASAPIAAGGDGTARFDFDLAFTPEGDGSLRVSGLPDPTDPIRMEWVKRVPPPPPDVHADEIARKILVGIGVSILLIGYVALKIWAAQ